MTDDTKAWEDRLEAQMQAEAAQLAKLSWPDLAKWIADHAPARRNRWSREARVRWAAIYAIRLKAGAADRG